MGEEIATTNTAIVPNAQNLRLLATDMFNSQMFKGITGPAQAVAIIQMGAELGFGPVTSLNIIKIIQGQMTVAARGLLALAQNKAGVSWKAVESSPTKCTIVFSRPKWDDMTISFTLDEARAAGLVRPGGGWEKYPQDMLFARCASRGVRRIAPDAISGLYSTEEMQDAVPFHQGGTVVVEAQGSEVEEDKGQGVQTTAGGESHTSPAPSSPTPSKFHLLKEIGEEKARVGEEKYYNLLMNGGFKHAIEVPVDRRAKLLSLLRKMENAISQDIQDAELCPEPDTD